MTSLAIMFCLQPQITHGATVSITLDTGKSLSLDPDTTGSMTFSFTNAGSTITDYFLSWTLGLQVRPSGSVSGTVTFGTLAQAASNTMPIGANPDIVQPNQQTLASSATINGSTTFYSMSMQTTEFLGTVNAGTSYNMGTLDFTASTGASGTWNVYAVTQGGGDYHNFWVGGDLADFDFSNLPSSAGDSSLLLGTITVIPEPSSFALLSLGAAGLLTRRRCQPRQSIQKRQKGG